MKHKFVAIEGVIGVGKTTLTRLLQNKFDNAAVLLEVFEENPFLAGFYKDRDSLAFQTQLFFLLSRYHQQHEAVPRALRQGMLISDYTFAKDELFAWLNLKDDELAMYGRVHAALGEKIPKPDLIVYLHADHDVIMRRIALRDRPYERDMDPEYIRRLASAYEAWLSNVQDTAVLTINVNSLDYLSEDADLNHVASLIHQALDAQGPSSPPPDTPLTLLQNGRLPDFQSFHRQLDTAKSFDPDIFFNYILLTEEVGEVAGKLIKIWGQTKRLISDGRSPAEAHQLALDKYRPKLRSELADLLAYIIKLANYADIDLEKAYLEKMQTNIGRTWPKTRTLPDGMTRDE